MRYDPIICHRLLFAVRPPAEVVPQIGALFALPGMEGRRVPARNLHIAIEMLEDSLFYPAREVRAALGAGAKVEVEPFEIILDRLAGSHGLVALRPSRRLPMLQHLHEVVREARADAGLPEREGYRFNPTMTLVYREGMPFTRPIDPIVWRVEQLELVDSLVGSSRQDPVGHWPLVAGPSGPEPEAPRQYAFL